MYTRVCVYMYTYMRIYIYIYIYIYISAVRRQVLARLSSAMPEERDSTSLGYNIH